MELIQSVIVNIVPFLIVLSLLVYVHELGHYWVARINGVKVEVFSIGFGPEIFGWTNKNGTRWKVSYIPLGGYVKMFSDANAASQPDVNAIQDMTEEEKEQSLFHKSVWQRMAVSFAGPAANYIFAIALLGGLYATVGQKIPSDTVKVGEVSTEGAGYKAGLKTNDIVLAINGKPINSFQDLSEIVSANPNNPITMLVQRDDQELVLTATPTSVGTGDKVRGLLGIQQRLDFKIVERSLFSSIGHAAKDSMTMTVSTLQALGQMIIGKLPADGLSGPIGIATVTGKVAQKSLSDLLWFTAILSINLGLINLFPVPMLDGGHLLFYIIEAVRGKPVSEKAQEYAYRVGFMLVMTLIVFATWNDIKRIEVFQKLLSLFG